MARQSIRNHRKALEAISPPRGPLPKYRGPPRPKVKVEGMSYSMTVQVNDGPRRSFKGTTLAELDRDLKAAAAELGRGKG